MLSIKQGLLICSVIFSTGAACTPPPPACLPPNRELFGICLPPCQDNPMEFCAPDSSTRVDAARESGTTDMGPDVTDSGVISDVNTDSSTCSDLQNNPDHCGRCNNVCPSANNAERVCAMGACSTRCRMGSEMVMGRCELLAPRLIGPMSTSYVTTHRPTLRWELPAGQDGARIEICSTRACGAGEIEMTIDAVGTSVRPMAALTPGVHWWRAKGRLMGSTGTRTSATWEVFVRQRDTPVDTSWGSVLDVNGDGYADVATGSGGNSFEPAIDPTAVTVFLGGMMGLQAMPTIIVAPTNGSQFGFAVSSAGDVDGDGYADLIVGAPSFAGGAMGRAGKTYLYRGGALGINLAVVWETVGSTSTAQLGSSLSFVGDLNQDGYGDVAVGAPDSEPTGVGTVRIFLGSTTGLRSEPSQVISGIDPSEHFGVTVRTAGDLNGDRIADLFVASRRGGGIGRAVASVFLAGPLGFEMAPHRRFVRDMPDDFFGLASSCIGDSNGDGYTDLLVSSRSNYANIYQGAAAGISAAPSQVLNTTGEAISVAGADMNGDGFDDVIVGFPLLMPPMPIATEMGGWGWYAGGVAGIAGTRNIIWSREGTIGTVLGAVGDIDRDGLDDLFVSAYRITDANPLIHKAFNRYRASLAGPMFVSHAVGSADDVGFGAAISFCR